jgi:hypothetical protein
VNRESARARKDRAARVLLCNRFADAVREGREAPEFEDGLRNPGDLAQLNFTFLRISPKKSINSMLFQAVSPPLRP